MPVATVRAACDVGSTSVHLVVAVVGAGGLVESIHDESAFLGLGGTVDATGILGESVVGELVATLAAFSATASAAGARSLVVVATEPLRRALDAGRAVRRAEAAGLALNVLTHEEEALLMLVGATGGVQSEGELAVVDIGGGSTEIVVASPGVAARAMGLRLGAARLTARFVTHDPATAREIDAMQAAARAVLADAAAPAGGTAIVAVGGTAENILRLVAGRRGGGTLTVDGLRGARALLSDRPAEALAAEREMRPARVRLLPAGTAILGALLERFGADELEVSDAGVREGAMLVEERAGVAWRDRLPELARGWRPPVPAGGGTPRRQPPATAARPSA